MTCKDSVTINIYIYYWERDIAYVISAITPTNSWERDMETEILSKKVICSKSHRWQMIVLGLEGESVDRKEKPAGFEKLGSQWMKGGSHGRCDVWVLP